MANKILLSFDDRDNHLVVSIIRRLIDNEFEVYSNSSMPNQYLNQAYQRNYHDIKPNSIPNDIECCALIITSKYQNSMLGGTKTCPVVEKIHNTDKKLIPIKIGGDLPRITKFGLNKMQAIQVEEDEVERVVKFICKRNSSAVSAFKEYNIDTIINYYDPNYSLHGSPIDDKRQNIGYRTYIKTERALDNKVSTFCICLYKGIAYEKTYEHIINTMPRIADYIKDNKVFLLLPKEIGQKDYSIRKKNISNLFKIEVSRIYYTDEFVWKYCTPDFFKSAKLQYLNIGRDKFVSPYLSPYSYYGENEDNHYRLSSEAVIDDFIHNEEQSILFLAGSGGIGKTTLAKSIADYFLETQENSSVVFLDSARIINNLLKFDSEIYDTIDLYILYAASNQDSIMPTNRHLLEKDIFNYNLDNGNLLIILDGIDEIISKVPEFKFEQLLSSMKDNSTKLLGYGKLVITSRPGDWISKYATQNDEDSILAIYELLAFDETLARKYFEQRFLADRKIDYIIDDLKNILSVRGHEHSYRFPPFILDVASSFDDDAAKNTSKRFNSTLLNTSSIKLDYLIAYICEREIAKTSQEDIDKQIYILTQMSVKHPVRAAISDLLQILENNSINKEKIHSFLVHPLLDLSNNNIYFKYDFLKDYFKSIYLNYHLFIDKKFDILPDPLVEILINECRFESSLTNEVAKRIKDQIHYADFYQCVEQIILSMYERGRTETEITKAISGLFFTLISINNTPPTQQKNTEILKGVFSQDGILIRNLRLFNVPENIIFDLSGLKFRDCVIQGYNRFFDCRFDKLTFFDETCTIKNIGTSRLENITAIEYNFSPGMNMDYTISDAFKNKRIKQGNEYRQSQEVLKTFFEIFEERGYYMEREYETSMARFNKKNKLGQISFEDVEDICRKHGIIMKSKRDFTYLEIQKASKGEVEKLCKEHFITPIIDLIIKDMIETIF